MEGIMTSKMNQIVQSVANVTIPDNILKKVDINGLLKEFSEDYTKLDKFQESRKRHEERNAVSRWWNSDELEEAQLDAAELQASFSKKLGQLMVISVAQSQQLHEQQNGLTEQQNIIKNQTAKLAENDADLNKQQSSLEEQNQKLEKLINEYFELKGLTQEGALKLIKIAKEIQETKRDLLVDFDKRIENVQRTHHQIANEQSEWNIYQAQQLESHKISLEQKYSQLEKYTSESVRKIKETDKKRQDALESIQDNINLSLETVKQKTDITNQITNELKEELILKEFVWRNRYKNVVVATSLLFIITFGTLGYITYTIQKGIALF